MSDVLDSDTEDAGEDMFVELFTLFGDKLDVQSAKINRLTEAVEDTRAELHRQAEAQAKTAELLRQLIGIIMSDQMNAAVGIQLMKYLSTEIDDKRIIETAAESLGKFRGMGWLNLLVAYERHAAELAMQRKQREAERGSSSERVVGESVRITEVGEEAARDGEDERKTRRAGQREAVDGQDRDR